MQAESETEVGLFQSRQVSKALGRRHRLLDLAKSLTWSVYEQYDEDLRRPKASEWSGAVQIQRSLDLGKT